MPRTSRSAVVLLAATGPLAAPALGQASEPHIFVANNGNLEGSLTSTRVEAEGALTFVDRVITGSRSTLSQPCPGCNTTAIDLTPEDLARNAMDPASDPAASAGVFKSLTRPRTRVQPAAGKDASPAR